MFSVYACDSLFSLFFLKSSKLKVVNTENSKNVPMISWIKVGLHVIKHSICFVSVKCSEPVLPYSSFIFTFCDTSVPFLYFQKPLQRDLMLFKHQPRACVFLSERR